MQDADATRGSGLPGTHSVTYQAIAATEGQFVLPPAQAKLALQPELMGLSAAGSFQVSRATLTTFQAQLPPPGTPADCPANCPGDCDVQAGACTPAASVTVPIAASGAAPAGGCDVGAMTQQCGSVDVADPRFCKSACHLLVVGMLSACQEAAPAVAAHMQQFAQTCSGH